MVGLLGGWGLAAAFSVELQEKRLSGLEWGEEEALSASARSSPASRASFAGRELRTPTSGPTVQAERRGVDGAVPSDPLPIRLVDMGGVGIPADTAAWGTSYSHATHAFDQLILDREPWVDPMKARVIREDWRRYLRRVGEMGSNAVVLDVFLELVNFDAVGSGTEVYPSGHPLRDRHRAYRGFVRQLTADAADLQMDVYLKTDLPAVTPPMRSYLRALPQADDPSTEAFWGLYAAAFDEIFDSITDVAGVVVRVGEAGPLYNVEGLDYSSYMGVREPAELQQMLRTLLPVFEERGRTLIFRSWSVGLGALGDLHNDSAVYEAVLGPIQSPALVVSTKFVQGDYFGFLPLNPTLLVGEHRRLIEFQARREYEGFGALPNYLGHAHAAALRQVLAANPRVVGTSTWAQEGGPLRAGPLSLFDVTGFWRWTDANVYATTRLSLDPRADPRTLAEEWARLTFGDDPTVAASLADLLMTSREAMEKGFYIRPYAEQRMEIVGVETPPLLWIFEWDVVGGWSSILASLYASLADDIETPIREGREAVALTHEMQAILDGLTPRIGAHRDFLEMQRSLDYQLSLFTALADFRESFLRYYAWLDRGAAPKAWRRAARRFEASATAHMTVYAGDLDFPALDFAPALATTEAALTEGTRTATARGLALLLLAGLALGTGWAQRRTGTFPGKGTARSLWRVGAGTDHRSLPGSPRSPDLLLAILMVYGTTVAGVGLVLPGGGMIPGGLAALLLAYTLALGLSWTGPRGGPEATGSKPSPGRDGVRRAWAGAFSAVGPVVWLTLVVLVVTAVRGPGYLWFQLWTNDLFRTLLFALSLGLGVWVLCSSFWLGKRSRRRRRGVAAGSVLVALGAVIVVAAGILPGVEGLLAALDEPLRLLPMRRAIINGITHYGGVAGVPASLPWGVGAGLVVLGVLVRGRDPTPARNRI